MKQILNDMKWSRYNLKIFFKRRNARRVRDAEIKKCLMEVEQILNDGSISPSWKFMKLSMLQTRVRMMALYNLPSYLPEKRRGEFVILNTGKTLGQKRDRISRLDRDDVRPC
jgi:hypothetical protein